MCYEMKPDEYVFSADECRLIVHTYCPVSSAPGACDRCAGAERCRLRRMAEQAGKYADLITEARK